MLLKDKTIKKKLKDIIKTFKPLITTNKIFYSYETPIILHTTIIEQFDGYHVDIKDLSKEQLNVEYYDSEWWIEEGDLCLKYRRGNN